jgi:hypothetical protein
VRVMGCAEISHDQIVMPQRSRRDQNSGKCVSRVEKTG